MHKSLRLHFICKLHCDLYLPALYVPPGLYVLPPRMYVPAQVVCTSSVCTYLWPVEGPVAGVVLPLVGEGVERLFQGLFRVVPDLPRIEHRYSTDTHTDTDTLFCVVPDLQDNREALQR